MTRRTPCANGCGRMIENSSTRFQGKAICGHCARILNDSTVWGHGIDPHGIGILTARTRALLAGNITMYRACAERGLVDGSIHLDGAPSWQAAYARELAKLCDTGRLHGPIRESETETYRGATLTRAWAGHINVSVDDGFCGGFKTTADAKHWIDGQLDRPRVVRVGPNTYASGDFPTVEYRSEVDR